jgi:hypothetical protein
MDVQKSDGAQFCVYLGVPSSKGGKGAATERRRLSQGGRRERTLHDMQLLLHNTVNARTLQPYLFSALMQSRLCCRVCRDSGARKSINLLLHILYRGVAVTLLRATITGCRYGFTCRGEYG